MTAERPISLPPFVCPACRAGVSPGGDCYRCGACGRDYPILFGIPDFRIRPDRYLSIDDERAKAARLHAFAQTASFDRLVDYYYSITDDVSPELAPRFARYVRDAPRRARAVMDALQPRNGTDMLLDAGCGSGGALVAAQGRFASSVGVDIGLRWLVIARKRLAEAGIPATLVCADVEALPFPDGSFSHAIADDLIEHAYDPDAAIAALARQLRPGGLLWLSAINRHWIGPHPAVGLWSAGLMPRGLRSRLIRALHGVDALRNMGFVSPGGVMRRGRHNGMEVLTARARRLDPDAVAERSRGFRLVAAIYGWLGSTPVLRPLMLRVGPTFEVIFRRNGVSEGDFA